MMQINRCPKCGREPKVKRFYCFGEYITIKCCNLSITYSAISEAEEAIAKWNEMTKRFPPRSTTNENKK